MKKMKNYLSITLCTLILFLSSCSYMSLSETGTLSIKQGNGEITPVNYISVNMDRCKECTVGEITDRVNEIMELYKSTSTVPTSCMLELLVVGSNDDGSVVAIEVEVSRKNAFGVRLAPEEIIFFYDINGVMTSITENGKNIIL